ncbi:hypothetical protein DKT69_08665 [Micromonospora sicca]|uniref:Uncharacterized protein n=1 Tax=Micromonospora sicca TaxID=2202420 RepID=A0A317DQ02_9ACTN|nr:hypothetical protein [Micromonospora sp. 4G51]PWR15886.1 hypothetical protein DKT69_08665 [Micromonospora sp. 4G51]
MKRRTLDLLFSIGGLGLAVLLLVVGIVLTTNANFANTYVHDQLGAQHISFKPADTLTDEEKKSDCLREYAGQALTTGKQAECYANEFIGLHLTAIGGGKTYADLGGPQTALKEQVAQAEQTRAANLADLQKQLADVTAQRETVFKGETLRGLLLTSYGFSEFGRKAEQGALAMYLGAALLLLLSLAGLVHAFRTPASATFAAPDEARERVTT